jgi:hypothetical protein
VRGLQCCDSGARQPHRRCLLGASGALLTPRCACARLHAMHVLTHARLMRVMARLMARLMAARCNLGTAACDPQSTQIHDTSVDSVSTATLRKRGRPQLPTAPGWQGVALAHLVLQRGCLAWPAAALPVRQCSLEGWRGAVAALQSISAAPAKARRTARRADIYSAPGRAGSGSCGKQSCGRSYPDRAPRRCRTSRQLVTCNQWQPPGRCERRSHAAGQGRCGERSSP